MPSRFASITNARIMIISNTYPIKMFCMKGVYKHNPIKLIASFTKIQTTDKMEIFIICSFTAKVIFNLKDHPANPVLEQKPERVLNDLVYNYLIPPDSWHSLFYWQGKHWSYFLQLTKCENATLVGLYEHQQRLRFLYLLCIPARYCFQSRQRLPVLHPRYHIPSFHLVRRPQDNII